MKINLIILIMLLFAIGAVARLIVPFSSWDQLKEESTDIIIAHGEKSTPPYPVINGPASDFSVKILYALKGTTNVISARLWTDHELQQGQNYLVFGYYSDGIYKAYEEYRVIPLGINFSANSIAGKPLSEQLQILFKQRIENLNREIQNDEREKQRLEEFFSK